MLVDQQVIMIRFQNVCTNISHQFRIFLICGFPIITKRQTTFTHKSNHWFAELANRTIHGNIVTIQTDSEDEITFEVKILADGTKNCRKVTIFSLLFVLYNSFQNIRPHIMLDRKSTRLNSSHVSESRMPSSA